jgi:DMSO/TMAO reductase YedYZ molybdopterin-dependent catalytic subunit
VNNTKKATASIITGIAVVLLLLNSFQALSPSTQAALSIETEWRLQISGLVDSPLNLTLSEIVAMPASTVQTTLCCVDFPTRIVEEGRWTGVQLRVLLEEAGVSPSAIKIAFFASDGYSTDLSLEAATQPDVIVAYEKDGTSMGGTVRIVAPGRWGYKWISQLARIEIVSYDFKGKWESLGYSDDGTDLGRSGIPDVSPVPDPTPTQQNTTTTLPTDPTPSNSSDTQPAQETQDPASEANETRNLEPLPIAPIAVAAIVSVAAVGSLMLAYLRKQKH